MGFSAAHFTAETKVRETAVMYNKICLEVILVTDKQAARNKVSVIHTAYLLKCTCVK